MRIYRQGNIIADVTIKKNSKGCYILEEIGTDSTVTLEFDILEPVEFEIDDYIMLGGFRYSIRYNESVKKVETSLGFSYTLVFHSETAKLSDWPFLPNGVVEVKKNFGYLTGTVEYILDLVLSCANTEDSGWTKGSVIDSEVDTYDLTDKMLIDVLQELASRNNTELWFYGKQVNICKQELPSGGLTLSQGFGGGLIDLSLSAVDKTKPYTVLFPRGSDKNIGHDYGFDYLVLPGGEVSIEKNVEKYGRKAAFKSFDIYPKGKFQVTEKVDNFTFKSNIDFNLTDCLIDGVEAVVTFQTGSLAGYDLNIVDGSWNNSLKQLKIKQNQDEKDLKIPGDLNFEEGDTFILTGIKMPQSYIDAAEAELLDRATKYLDEICEKKVQVDATCDPVEFKRRSITIALGQMVNIYSDKLKLDREIRCTRVKRYLEQDEETIPYRYEITLSDFLKSPSIKDRIETVEKLPEVVNKVEDKLNQFRGRAYRDVKELAAALPGMFTEFSESINPVSVNAMQMYLGSEELQYMFVTSKTGTEVHHEFIFNGLTKVFSTDGGWIRHMTIGITTLKPSHEVGEYKHWLVSSYVSSPLIDGRSRWLYIKASKSSETASFELTEVKLNHTGTDYYFLVGFLNSEYNGNRSWTSMYGWSEWTPGALRVNRISSTNGEAYFDLLGGVYQGRLIIKSGSSGYNELADKPDLNLYAEKIYVNAVKDGLETQIDGKVETWFQSVNPWGSWAPGTKQRHVGDLWYDTSTKKLYRYIGPSSNNWGTVEDAIAIAAMEDASKAKDTADGKRRVFLTTPYTPYDAGDLWTDGTNLRRCTTTRASGSYNSNDWGLATNYDNTQVVIDNGIVTAGTIQLAGDHGSILAGITGYGTTAASIRIWAGASFENRDNAPFRVEQSGKATMTNAVIEGTIIAKAGAIGAFSIGAQGGINSNQLISGDYALGNGNYLRLSGNTIESRANNNSGGYAWFQLSPYVDYYGASFPVFDINNRFYVGDPSGSRPRIVRGIRTRLEGGTSENIFFDAQFGTDVTMQIKSKQFSNDSGIQRGCFISSRMPSTSQINTIAPGSTKYNVKWDSQTGILFIE